VVPKLLVKTCLVESDARQSLNSKRAISLDVARFFYAPTVCPPERHEPPAAGHVRQGVVGNGPEDSNPSTRISRRESPDENPLTTISIPFDIAI